MIKYTSFCCIVFKASCINAGYAEDSNGHAERNDREKGTISEYTRCTIIDMSNKVLEHIAKKYHAVREGVKSVMGGKVLEYEAKTIKREGIKEGLEEGLKEGIKEGIKGTVSILRNLGIPQQTILSKIQEQYNLSPEASEKYL